MRTDCRTMKKRQIRHHYCKAVRAGYVGRYAGARYHVEADVNRLLNEALKKLDSAYQCSGFLCNIGECWKPEIRKALYYGCMNNINAAAAIVRAMIAAEQAKDEVQEIAKAVVLAFEDPQAATDMVFQEEKCNDAEGT